MMSSVRSYLPESINEKFMYGVGIIRCLTQPYISTEFNANALVTEPRMLIGDLASASNRDAMIEQGITHVLCVLNGGIEQFPNEFEYMIVHANDDPWVSIEDYFDDAIIYIDKALTSSPDAKILVHCQRGASRSVTLVAAYLLYNLNRAKTIKRTKIRSTVSGVIDTIRLVRDIACPNDGFMESLNKYVCKLNNYTYVPPEDTESSDSSTPSTTPDNTPGDTPIATSSDTPIDTPSPSQSPANDEVEQSQLVQPERSNEKIKID